MGLVMTLVIKVGEADAQLAELLTKVEAGDEVVIERAGRPVARITRVAAVSGAPAPDTGSVVEDILAARARRQPASREEVQAWKNEGRA